MGDVVETLTRGNVIEVKVILASVVLALAVYQLVLIAVGFRVVRPPFLRSRGDVIAALLVVVAIMCLSYIGLEDDGAFHAVTGFLLLLVLGVKVVVIRWWHAAGRFLPVLGITVFVLLAATWASTAGAFLA